MISRKKEKKAQVAAKSNEAQDSFLIPLLDDGHLGAKLDMSPNSLSFPPLFQDDFVPGRQWEEAHQARGYGHKP